MKTKWQIEVERCEEKSKEMSTIEFYNYIWQEYQEGRISKRAHDHLVKFHEDE